MNYKHKAIMPQRSECEGCPFEKGKPENCRSKKYPGCVKRKEK